MSTQSRIPAWRIPWTAEPDWLQSMGSQRVGCEGCALARVHALTTARGALQRHRKEKQVADPFVFTGEGNDNPLQYCGLENSVPRGTWQAAVHGVEHSQTQLSEFHFVLILQSSLCS